MAVQPIQFFPSVEKKDFFFNVSEEHVFVGDSVHHAQRWRGHKALFKADLNEPISLVSHRFFVINHQQAHELGQRVFMELFGVAPLLNKQTISAEGTEYLAEFVHDQVYLEFDQTGYRLHGGNDLLSIELGDNRRFYRSEMDIHRTMNSISPQPLIAKGFRDQYHPFIRVINYLREGKSFSIELGYYRSRCCNGLLFGSRTSMAFRRSYLSPSIHQVEVDAVHYFQSRRRDVMNLGQSLFRLLITHCAPEHLHLVAMDIFQKQWQRANVDQRKAYLQYAKVLAKKYLEEIGCNVNAALNVATEFAQFTASRLHTTWSLQRLCSDWVKRTSKTGFDFERYFDRLTKMEATLLNDSELDS